MKMDFKCYREVENYLKGTGKETLYSFFGVNPSNTDDELSERLFSVSTNENHTSDTKNEPLLSLARQLLLSGEGKEQYNNYLLTKKDVWDELLLRQSYGIREISFDECKNYADRIKYALDVDDIQAFALLKEGMDYYGISSEQATVDPVFSAKTEPEIQPKDGIEPIVEPPLDLPANAEEEPEPYSSQEVGTIDLSDPVPPIIEADAERFLLEESAIRNQIRLKNYCRAFEMASQLPEICPSCGEKTAKLLEEINSVLVLARAQVQQAITLKGQDDESVTECALKALELCADYEEAAEILPPPAAPGNIKLGITIQGAVRIEWSKRGNQAFTTYSLVKKIGSKPKTVTDGVLLESDLTGNTYEDGDIVAATPYYYGVFATRLGKNSGLTAGNGAVQLFPEVQNVHQEVAAGTIRVKWDAPANVTAIEVWKKEGTAVPLSAGDGVQLMTVSRDGFTDDEAAGECSYLILCQYDVNGTIRSSRGVRQVFCRYERIPQLGKVSIVPHPTGSFQLKSTPPEGGKVSVIYSREKLSCHEETVLPMTDFRTVCKNAAKAEPFLDAEQNMLFTLPQNQVVWAYPMVSNEQLFVLSAPVLLNTVTGISNVSFTESNGTVKITGTAAPAVKNIIVKISSTRFPLGIHDDGEKIVISKEYFELDQGAVVKIKPDVLSFISVLAELEHDGASTYTTAVPVGSEPFGTLKRKVVRYSIEYTVSPTKKFPVTLKFAADEELEIPGVCVVKGSPRPMDRHSGELVEKLPTIRLKKGLFSKTFTAKHTLTAAPDSTKMKFIAFMDDDIPRNIQLKEVKSL